MRKIGVIQQLQVQTTSLKQGEKSQRYYDPAGIQRVSALRLTHQGVIGLENGQAFNDVHHAEHPQSKNRALTNGISFNFTSHYTLMQQRFGPHLSYGIAGENILIVTDETFAESALAGGVIIQTQDGQMVPLTQIGVAAPCAPFSEFALNLEERPPTELLKATLQFLDEGVRGFYCQAVGDSAMLHIEDKIYLA
ncbi:MAG: hypothetical protein U0350_03405 [Caldilineaceae bacterium]